MVIDDDKFVLMRLFGDPQQKEVSLFDRRTKGRVQRLLHRDFTGVCLYPMCKINDNSLAMIGRYRNAYYLCTTDIRSGDSMEEAELPATPTHATYLSNNRIALVAESRDSRNSRNEVFKIDLNDDSEDN